MSGTADHLRHCEEWHLGATTKQSRLECLQKRGPSVRENALCAVYIMANERSTVLYTGVTGDLRLRVFEHKARNDPRSFTARYNVTKLVFFETTPDITAAIAREKQIKAGSRKKKIELIVRQNPNWRDLSAEWV